MYTPKNKCQHCTPAPPWCSPPSCHPSASCLDPCWSRCSPLRLGAGPCRRWAAAAAAAVGPLRTEAEAGGAQQQALGQQPRAGGAASRVEAAGAPGALCDGHAVLPAHAARVHRAAQLAAAVPGRLGQRGGPQALGVVPPAPANRPTGHRFDWGWVNGGGKGGRRGRGGRGGRQGARGCMLVALAGGLEGGGRGAKSVSRPAASPLHAAHPLTDALSCMHTHTHARTTSPRTCSSRPAHTSRGQPRARLQRHGRMRNMRGSPQRTAGIWSWPAYKVMGRGRGGTGMTRAGEAKVRAGASRD